MLVLVLACPTQAGHIHNDVAGTPLPPTPPGATQEGTAAAGDIQNDESGGLTGTVLSLLESMLALL